MYIYNNELFASMLREILRIMSENWNNRLFYF